MEEGDFYSGRLLFYFHINEIDKAIQDAQYLRDSASYSRFWRRGEYYNDWALYALYTLHICNHNYQEALEAIDTFLEKRKRNDPKVYYVGSGALLYYRHKIILFEYFNKTAEIIPYLKKSFKENFAYYFKIADTTGYYTIATKRLGFTFLKLIVDEMKKQNNKELPKYQKIYEQLRYQLNPNFETINPNISDSTLQSIVSEIN